MVKICIKRKTGNSSRRRILIRMFDPKACEIPKIWCGKGNKPNTYSKKGTPYDCMKIGFGAGMHTERKKNISPTSLQNIKYVGETFEKRFVRKKITSTTSLLKFATKSSKSQIDGLLREVFIRKSCGLDKRAYNSTLMYLYQHGISSVKIPSCSKI